MEVRLEEETEPGSAVWAVKARSLQVLKDYFACRGWLGRHLWVGCGDLESEQGSLASGFQPVKVPGKQGS